MAEAHPVGFRWVMKAKERGARVIHVDPRYGRTSQLADLHVPIRAGTDVAFIGGLIRHVIETESYFKEYVVSYTNASTLVCDGFRDTEDLDGVFSGFDSATGRYDPASWGYEDCVVGLSAGAHEHATQAFSEHTGAGMDLGSVRHDDTLQDPRCVFQVLRRHFSRYTPETVEQICGISRDQFMAVADEMTAQDLKHASRILKAVVMPDAPEVHAGTGVLSERLRGMLVHSGRETDRAVLVAPGGRVVPTRGRVEA